MCTIHWVVPPRHLQHIRVQESLHASAYVIDCPGLVFPSLASRAQAC